MTVTRPPILRNTIINILLPRTFVIGLLASFYSLAYIISPYWLMPASTSGIIATLILTIGIGGVWCYFSADALQIRVDTLSWLFFIALLAGVIALNYQSLRYDIPWRGDEEFHINKTLWLVDFVSPKWITAYFIVLAVFLYASWKQKKLAVIFGGVILFLVIAGYTALDLIPKVPNLYLRYPFVNYLIYLIVPSLTASKYPYHETLFRVVPVLCAGAVVWVTLQKLSSTAAPVLLLFGGAIATIPVIFYYSSILYLEMPAVLLMLIVSLNIKSLLHDNFEQIRKSPAWYALILIGFIKETTISFLFCFLFCKLMIFFIQRAPVDVKQGKGIARTLKHYILEELPIVLLTSLPLLFYIFLRSAITDVRSFSPNLFSLLEVSVYPVLARSFAEQFGVFILFFTAGCVVLFLEKEYSVVFFYILTFLFIPLFHVVDNIAFTGYSRFNLFILPVVLAGANVAVRKMTENKKIPVVMIICAAIAVNLWISPVYPDGSKQPMWGNYFADTSEHYYPYQEALTWLKKNHHDSLILFVNGNYSYSYEFYFYQLNWHPDCGFSDNNEFEAGAEIKTISSVLAKAEDGLFDVVVYQVVEKDTLLPQNAGAYDLKKVFINDAGKALAIYAK